jgi:hypothetical protein
MTRGRRAPGQAGARRPARGRLPARGHPPGRHPAWTAAWRRAAPGCDPARALTVAEPLAHLAYAVRYQEFLDGIEPTERIYHAGDPAAAIRTALRLAREPSLWAAAPA